MSSSEADLNDDVQDLISRYRTGGSPATKKRERTASPEGEFSESADSAKRPMKDDQPGSGKFEKQCLSEDDKEKVKGRGSDEELPVLEIHDVNSDSHSEESDFDSDLDPDPDPALDPDSLDQAIEVSEDTESGDHLYDNVFPNAKISYIDDSDCDAENEDNESSAPAESLPEIKFEPAQEPEQKKVKGFQDEVDVAMVTEEGLSSKEQLSRHLQEKDIEDVEENEDTLGSLDAVAAVIKKKANGSSGGGDAAELDFSVIQSTHHLNVEASKQRVELRQKGSLAQRRRPTRTSMRHKSSSEDDLYEDSTERKVRPVNGHEGDDEEYFKPQRKKSDGEELISSDQGPVLRTGKTLQGIKTPILLPGLAEGRAKLRSKPVVPLPKEENSGDKDSPAPPKWLSEARLRQTARPPKGETEKLQQEREPETPAWMKDALSKKKKVPTATLR